MAQIFMALVLENIWSIISGFFCLNITEFVIPMLQKTSQGQKTYFRQQFLFDTLDLITNVYIYYMDEILILLISLLKETHVESFNGPRDIYIQKDAEIDKMWEKNPFKLHFAT